jgi:glutathione synthase/RimK-type ligase-like ATP-grasp enzyme
LVEYVTTVDQEYEKIVEEYEEEVLVQEFLEPPMTDIADATPA